MSESASVIETEDPVVRSLLPGYVARRREELGTLRSLLGAARFGEMKNIGHNLAGSGGAYGLPVLTEIGRSIEAAADAGDEALLTLCLDRLSDQLDRAAAELGAPAA